LSYHGVKDVALVQTGGTPQAISSLAQKLVDGIIVSPPATYRLINEGYNEIVSHKDVANMGVEFLTNGIVARRSFANKNKDVVIRLIKGTMEGLKSMHSDPTSAKRAFSKYTRLTDPKLVDQSYRFALDVITKDPTVSAPSMQSIVRNLVQWNIVDATAAGTTPLTAFYDNSYVEEIKRSGFLAQLWK
jgi:ABC-type nitrate/sulfonate/bicarbonate transport system substrate-binding protein